MALKPKPGDPAPPNRTPSYQKKLDEGIRLLRSDYFLTIKEIAPKVGVSVSSLGSEWIRVVGRERIPSTTDVETRTEEENLMWDEIIRKMQEGFPMTVLEPEYRKYGVTANRMRLEWRRRGLPPRDRRVISNPRHDPVTLAMFRFMRDGEWHEQERVIEAGAMEVTPGSALRALEASRRHSLQVPEGAETPPRKRNLDVDQRVWYGKRLRARSLLGGTPYIARKEEGDRVYRRLLVEDLPALTREKVFNDPDEGESEAR